ncbi:MAG: hypothetical protein EOM80_15965 [Erysipelotrichia bacterium]|nr:hypothetical protein [Erysipelotrichia bacterium]
MTLYARKGFIIYIVMAVLLALAIMAFALNTFKRGAITQLAKNIDQNRLALLAQSANAEVVAMIRSKVNIDSGSQIFAKFRSIFPGSPSQSTLNADIVLFSNFEPQQTLEVAKTAGYPLQIKSRAVLKVYRKAAFSSVSAYNGYLDVYSQAYRDGAKENLIEVHERRDVRLVDMRHNLDKYVLFVKNYSPDYNNTRRRISLQGIPASGPDISRVYIGNDNYPNCTDDRKDLWLDLYYEENKDLPGFRDIFNFTSRSKFPDGSGPECLFAFRSVDFSSFTNVTLSQFYMVPAVMKVYEKFVNEAANGCLGKVVAAEVGDKLKKKCKDAMGSSNSNAASYQVCEDFAKNADGLDYSKCTGFGKILSTCVTYWKYHYGYTDAASIWHVDKVARPNLPNPKNWATALAYKGLSDKSDDFGKKGPYFYEYLDDASGKDYNPERMRVGTMLRLYGANNKTPVLVEGPAFLRFFKLAYLNDFETTIEFLNGPQVVNPEPVPMMFNRPDRPKTFLNTVLGNELAPTSYFSEKYMMSRAVDSLSVNALLGTSVSFYDGDGKPATINPLTHAHPTFVRPSQKTGSNFAATNFGRLIDFPTITRNYPSALDFYNERVGGTAGSKVLYVDGVMYIESGDLDLSDVKNFYGKGMVYLGRGNCIMGSLTRQRNLKSGDSLRIYLRQGDFIIKSPASEIDIDASLAAFYYPFGSADPKKQGSLILNRKDKVRINGNLLVDYLYTQDTSDSGLSEGGDLVVTHDPLIYDPSAEIDGVRLDPYHISIGSVKTLFSLNAGGKTF